MKKQFIIIKHIVLMSGIKKVSARAVCSGHPLLGYDILNTLPVRTSIFDEHVSYGQVMDYIKMRQYRVKFYTEEEWFLKQI